MFLITMFAGMCILNAQNAPAPDSLRFYLYPGSVTIHEPRIALPLMRTPFSVSLIEKDNLQNAAKFICVDEAVRYVPGVKVDNQADGERIHFSIRGQGILSEHGVRGTRVLLDGIPVNDPTGFAADFYDVDWSNVTSLEVLKGAGASLYGGSASAGLINISTLNGFDKTIGTIVGGDYGTNNSAKGFLHLGGKASEQTEWRASFSRALGDGWRTHTHYQGNNASLKFMYTPSDKFTITPVFNYVRFYNENPEGINLLTYQTDPQKPNDDAIPFNEYMETERTTFGFTGKLGLSEALAFDFSAYGKGTNYTEANNHFFQRRRIDAQGGNLQFSHLSQCAGFANSVSVGADFQHQLIYARTKPNEHSQELNILIASETIVQREVGAYLIDKVETEKITVFGNLRYDNIYNQVLDDFQSAGSNYSGDKKFDQVTGKIGVAYKLSPNHTVFANWGTGFMPPATEELQMNPKSAAGFNDELKAAKSAGTEAGMRGLLNKDLFYDVTLFYLSTDNDFDRYRIPGQGDQTYYHNTGASNRFGAEVYAHYSPIPAASFQVAYTFSDFKYNLSTPVKVVMDDKTVIKYVTDGAYLPNSPVHQLNFEAAYFVIPKLRLSAEVEAMSKWFIDGANLETEKAAGYALLHLKVSYQFEFAGKSLDLHIAARNIFDKQYLGFTEPDPGGNAYQPAAKRQFFVGAKVSL